jgi:hypothetical protein
MFWRKKSRKQRARDSVIQQPGRTPSPCVSSPRPLATIRASAHMHPQRGTHVLPLHSFFLIQLTTHIRHERDAPDMPTPYAPSHASYAPRRTPSEPDLVYPPEDGDPPLSRGPSLVAHAPPPRRGGSSAYSRQPPPHAPPRSARTQYQYEAADAYGAPPAPASHVSRSMRHPSTHAPPRSAMHHQYAEAPLYEEPAAPAGHASRAPRVTYDDQYSAVDAYDPAPAPAGHAAHAPRARGLPTVHEHDGTRARGMPTVHEHDGHAVLAKPARARSHAHAARPPHAHPAEAYGAQPHYAYPSSAYADQPHYAHTAEVYDDRPEAEPVRVYAHRPHARPPVAVGTLTVAQRPPHAFRPSACTGRRRGLCVRSRPLCDVDKDGGLTRRAQIGINYAGTQNALMGCVNDARNMREFLMRASCPASPSHPRTHPC